MASLFGELQRRNVFRVAIVYVVVGWVVLQVAEIIAPIMNLPDWTVPMVLFIGIVGFPFAMIFTWAFELTPDGLKRTEDVHPEESISGHTGQALNRAIIGLMAIAIVLLLVDRLLLTSAPDEMTTEIVKEQEAAGAEATAVDTPKSIAVLPFVNMSDDPKQEYFSDGISEELLHALSRISGLRVAARTSSFFFKGKNQDITEIGNKLNVDTILEGSVRKSGTRLRITAQLINVEDGYHMWSETYDRELTDIFAIQDEISAAIVAALQVHLTGTDAVVDTRPVNVEAYNFVLLGRDSVRQRTRQSLELAVKQYQKALEIDPAYAAAWAGKALATLLLSTDQYGTTPVVEAHRQAQAMLDTALSLNPDLGLAHATQSLIYQQKQEPFAALESINRAIQANPSVGILYAWKSQTLWDLGRANESAEALETGFRIDPLHWVLRNNFARRLVFGGDYRQARELVVPDSADAYRLEARIALLNGHYADAVGYGEKRSQSAERDGTIGDQNWLAYVYQMLLRNPEMALQSVSAPVAMIFQAYIDPAAGYPMLINLPEQQQNNSTRGTLNYVLLRTGRCDELLQLRADRGYLEKPLHGYPGADFSRVGQASIYAWCLKQQGRDAEAQLLAQRIKTYIEGAVANGQPPDYLNLLARVQMVLGEKDEALGSLKLAWQYYDLYLSQLEGPFDELLHDREEFRELRSEMLDHTNSERAKLGWEPVTF